MTLHFVHVSNGKLELSCYTKMSRRGCYDSNQTTCQYCGERLDFRVSVD